MEKNGAIEAYTKTFVKILRKPSPNPLKFTAENINHAIVQKDIIKCLENDISKTKNAVKVLKEIIDNAKKNLADHRNLVQPKNEIQQ